MIGFGIATRYGTPAPDEQLALQRRFCQAELPASSQHRPSRPFRLPAYLTAQRISKCKLKQALLSDVFWSSIRLNSSATGTGTGASQQFAHYSAHAHTTKLESRCWIVTLFTMAQSLSMSKCKRAKPAGLNPSTMEIIV